MKNTLSRFKMAALAVPLLGLGTFTTQAASTLGFNYWPGGWGGPSQHCDSQVLSNVNWTAANKAVIQRDLDHMASLGAGVIRFVLWPGSDGWILGDNLPHGPGGAQFQSIFAEQKTNIVELIGFCKARNMKVIICFANSYMGLNVNTNNYYWKEFYLPRAGNDDILAFTHFLWDTQYWITGFVNSIENSANASTVLYYDMFSEYYRLLPHMDWYATFVFDYGAIPDGKKGESILGIDDAEAFRVAMGPRLPYVSFTDFHSYPAQSPIPDVNYPDVASAYNQMRAKFPLSTTIMGEFGYHTGDPGHPEWTEAIQESKVVEIAGKARDNNIRYHLHWLFIDKEVNQANYFGLGYSPHHMKDAMGGLSALENMIPNSDMESVTGGVPTSWGFGSSPTGNTTFIGGGPNQADASTKLYYGRITRNVASGTVWMNAPSFFVSSTTNKKLYVDFFLRSSMTNICPTIHEYAGDWTPIGTPQTGTTFTPPTWTWYDYRTSVGTQSFTLNSATRNIIITINGTTGGTAFPYYLDVDTVSAFVQ
jgi:hypothetical protein